MSGADWRQQQEQEEEQQYLASLQEKEGGQTNEVPAVKNEITDCTF